MKADFDETHFNYRDIDLIVYDFDGVMTDNDLNDLAVMEIVGFPVAPADAHPKIKRLSKLITEAKGGEGVIKEVSDYAMVS